MTALTPSRSITLVSAIRFFSTEALATRIEKEVLVANQYQEMYGSWVSESDVKLIRKYLPTSSHIRHLLHKNEAAIREIAAQVAHDGYGQYQALNTGSNSMKSCYLVQTAICLFLIARNSETLEEATRTMANLRRHNCSVWAKAMQPYISKEIVCVA